MNSKLLEISLFYLASKNVKIFYEILIYFNEYNTQLEFHQVFVCDDLCPLISI